MKFVFICLALLSLSIRTRTEGAGGSDDPKIVAYVPPSELTNGKVSTFKYTGAPLLERIETDSQPQAVPSPGSDDSQNLIGGGASGSSAGVPSDKLLPTGESDASDDSEENIRSLIDTRSGHEDRDLDDSDLLLQASNSGIDPSNLPPVVQVPAPKNEGGTQSTTTATPNLNIPSIIPVTNFAFIPCKDIILQNS
ncbi:hypothetical protein HMI56_005008 [Coelomomyces lativittatus]|nr:hypothetical protein HMI56_005008 [Coelomomyces lativittatus]